MELFPISSNRSINNLLLHSQASDGDLDCCPLDSTRLDSTIYGMAGWTQQSDYSPFSYVSIALIIIVLFNKYVYMMDMPLTATTIPIPSNYNNNTSNV